MIQIDEMQAKDKFQQAQYMVEECWAFFKIAKELDYISDWIEMTTEEEEVADDLKWKMLEEDEQQEYLTKKIRRKSIYDFLKNDSPSRQRTHDYSTNGMKYATSQMLDKVNEILDKKLKEPTWEDEMEWEKDDFLYDYNPAEVMAAEEVRIMRLTPEQ